MSGEIEEMVRKAIADVGTDVRAFVIKTTDTVGDVTEDALRDAGDVGAKLEEVAAEVTSAAIEAMTRFPCVGTFDLALSQLDAPGSEAAAAEAALTIARTVLDLDPQRGRAGLKKLIDANISERVTASAQALLQ